MSKKKLIGHERRLEMRRRLRRALTQLDSRIEARDNVIAGLDAISKEVSNG